MRGTRWSRGLDAWSLGGIAVRTSRFSAPPHCGDEVRSEFCGSRALSLWRSSSTSLPTRRGMVPEPSLPPLAPYTTLKLKKTFSLIIHFCNYQTPCHQFGHRLHYSDNLTNDLLNLLIRNKYRKVWVHIKLVSAINGFISFRGWLFEYGCQGCQCKILLLD